MERGTAGWSGIRWIVCVLVIVLCCSGAAAFAASARTGLRNVRIGYYTMRSFQAEAWLKMPYDEAYEAYSYEYMLALAQYAGWNCEFIPVNYEEGLHMLLQGKLDIMSRAERTPELEQTLAFAAAAPSPQPRAVEYFAVMKANRVLLQEMNEAVAALEVNDPSFTAELHEKYYGKGQGEILVLTPAEQDYILEHPVVRVSYDPDWYLISYRSQEGRFAGVMAKIYDRIAAQTGLKFEFQANDSFLEAMEAFESGRTELMAELPYDYLWANRHNARLTLPCQKIPIVAVYKQGEEQLHTVALPPGYYQQYLSEEIRKDGYVFHNYSTIAECLDAVLRNEADCVFLNTLQLEYYRKFAKYSNLSFRVMPSLGYRLSTAVSKSADPRLFSIITKGLAGMSQAELDQMFRESPQNMKTSYWCDAFYDNPRIMLWGSMALAGLLVVSIVYSVILRKRNARLQTLAAQRKMWK